MVEEAVSWTESEPTCSLTATFVTCSMRVSVLQARNTANEVTDGCVQNFAARCCGGLNRIRMITSMRELSGTTFDSLHKNFA